MRETVEAIGSASSRLLLCSPGLSVLHGICSQNRRRDETNKKNKRNKGKRKKRKGGGKKKTNFFVFFFFFSILIATLASVICCFELRVLAREHVNNSRCIGGHRPRFELVRALRFVGCRYFKPCFFFFLIFQPCSHCRISLFFLIFFRRRRPQIKRCTTSSSWTCLALLRSR